MTDLVAQHLAHLKSVGRAATTIEAREDVLRRLDRELPMGLVKAFTEELEAWLAGPDERPWSRQTRATYFAHVVGFYRWASDPARPVGMDYDPSVGLIRPPVPPGQPRPVTSEQLAYARGKLANPWRLYVELAAFAGLRSIEIARLDREDVSKTEILVRRGKGDKTRVIDISPDLWKLVAYLPAGPVARTTRGERANSRDVYINTNKHLARIGLHDVTLHRFRHWCATYLLDEGAEVTAVQQALGHGSLNTTARYLALTDRQRAKLRKATCALPALAPTPS